MHPADLSIAQVGFALRRTGLTCVDLVQAHLDRIAARNPALHAFVALCPARALAAAAVADQELGAGHDRGPLHGIPFGVKDLIDVAGLPTRCGSFATSDAIVAQDAFAVAQLVQAGAIPLGKLATYEFALTGPSFDGPFPPALNPANPQHITGGSSSGSAVAVAAGMVRFALGTDTGGSIRSPAAFCGVVGLKPAFGMLPMAGVAPLSLSMDHLGPIAASVADAAEVMAVFAPIDISGGVKGLCIGYARDWFADDPATDIGCLGAIDASVERLEKAGARVVPIALPDYQVAEAAGAIILHAEALELHLARLRDLPERYGKQARQSLAAGAGIGAEDIATARSFINKLRNEIDEILSGFDAILTAVTLAPAPRLAAFAKEQTVWTPMRTLPFNLTGHPALSVPVGRLDGLPVAAQVIGADAAMICRVGAAIAG